MATKTRFFRSTDQGAPVSNAVAGGWITLLDAILVNGYNTQTITCTQTSGVVTATCTAHGFVQYQVVRVSGATPTDYNGDFYVTSATANTFTYTIANAGATSPATGTISCKVAPLDWTKPFTGTNLAAYKTGSGSLGHYLRCDHTGTQEGRFVGYSAMTSISVGDDIFPDNVQLAGGEYWAQSDTNGVTRAWQAWGNENIFYIRVMRDGTAAGSHMHVFGDIIPLDPNDGWCTVIIGNTALNEAGIFFGNMTSQDSAGALGGHYMCRIYGGANSFGGSIQVGKQSANGKTPMFGGYQQFPSPATNSIELDEIWIIEGGNIGFGYRRGRLPGIYDYGVLGTWAPDATIITGSSPNLVGRTFIFYRVAGNSSQGGIIMEIGGSWT